MSADASPRPKAHTVTRRDLDMLAWIGRWRAVTAAQLQTEFDRRAGSTRHREVYDRRVRILLSLGLIRRAQPIADLPRVLWLTRAGHRAAGLDGAPAEPSIGELQHDLEVVALALHLADIQPTHQLVTEQEIRRTEPHPTAGPAAALRMDQEISAGRGTGGRGYPDLASVVPGPGRDLVWVHELERSPKTRARWLSVMLAYIYADHVHGCVYWAWPSLLGAIQGAADEANRTAKEAGLPAGIDVQRWTPQFG